MCRNSRVRSLIRAFWAGQAWYTQALLTATYNAISFLEKRVDLVKSVFSPHNGFDILRCQTQIELWRDICHVLD